MQKKTDWEKIIFDMNFSLVNNIAQHRISAHTYTENTIIYPLAIAYTKKKQWIINSISPILLSLTWNYDKLVADPRERIVAQSDDNDFMY